MFFGKLIKHETIDSILGRMDGRKIRDERKNQRGERKFGTYIRLDEREMK